MKNTMFLMVFVALLVVPMVSYAETGQKCASDCVNKCAPLGSGKEYATCLENCLKGCYDKPTGTPDVPPPTPVKPSKTRYESGIKASDETRVSGTIHLGKIDPYWLRSDQPLYVFTGSKSEAKTNDVKLSVPAELLEKAKKLDGRHVVVTGIMNCTGNWAVGAQCNMVVKQIDMAE